MKFRIWALVGFFTIASGLLVFRAFQLQIMPHKKVENLAKRQLERNLSVVGRRGVIKDRKGNELAVSVNSRSLYVNPRRVKNRELLVEEVSFVLGWSPSRVRNILYRRKDKSFVWLKRQLNSTQMMRLEQVDLSAVSGLGVLPEYRRIYPFKSSAAHVLGFVSIDGKGLAGVESSMDAQLAGEERKMRVSRDAKGRPIFNHIDQLRLDDTKGEDLQLSLDIKLQLRVEALLAEAVEHHSADRAWAAMMNPHTGEILAMALYPNFDLNNFSKAPAQLRRMRIVTDPHEPGSTVKPFVVAEALDKGVVNLDTLVSGGGGQIKIGRKTITEADRKHAFDELSVRDVVKYSSNVGTINLQRELGFDNVFEAYRKLGFLEKTGIELKGESRGLLKMPKANQELERATLSYGHGMAVTPIQMLRAYASIANGGYLPKPTLIKNNGNPQFGEQERVFKVGTIESIRDTLEGVVHRGGTGGAAGIEGFRVAGKTGTAWRVKENGRGYEKGAYISSFAGFFPSKNPDWVAVVSVENPTRNGRFATATAAPLFRKITEAYLAVADKAESNLLVRANDDQSKKVGSVVYELRSQSDVHSTLSQLPSDTLVRIAGNGNKLKSTDEDLVDERSVSVFEFQKETPLQKRRKILEWMQERPAAR